MASTVTCYMDTETISGSIDDPPLFWLLFVSSSVWKRTVLIDCVSVEFSDYGWMLYNMRLNNEIETGTISVGFVILQFVASLKISSVPGSLESLTFRDMNTANFLLTKRSDSWLE